MHEFSPQTYDAIINLLSSALAGLAVFLLGLFMGWLFWRDHGRRSLRRVEFGEMTNDGDVLSEFDSDVDPEND
ncbi:MAG: hypothetical protein AAGH89_14950 [Verrucomicrobiota bacterium]